MDVHTITVSVPGTVTSFPLPFRFHFLSESETIAQAGPGKVWDSICCPEAPPPLVQKSIARHTPPDDVEAVELAFLVAHAADGRFASKQPAEVGADIRRARAIAVLWELATYILTDAQS